MPATRNEVLLVLAAVEAQLEGSINLLQLAKANALSVHVEPVQTSHALAHARVALVDIRQRIEVVKRVQARTNAGAKVGGK